MKPWVKKLAIFIFGLSALKLVIDGHWYQGLVLWGLALFALVYYEKRLIERQVNQILPKLYVCAKPEEYLEWLDDLEKTLVLKPLFQEKLMVYRYSGWLYQVGRPLMSKTFSTDFFEEKKPKGRFEDPARQLEGKLLDRAERYRKFLNEAYRLYVEGNEAMRVISYEQLAEMMDQHEASIVEGHGQKQILSLIGHLLLAKWALSENKRALAEERLNKLRETEVFNLMFGEVNYHLSQVAYFKKQWEQSAYYLRVALNFADGTALETVIVSEMEKRS